MSGYCVLTRHANNKEESYIGLTDNTFKTRQKGHTSSFRNEKYMNATTLSNYIWTLKDKNINYSLKWKIIDRGRAYQPSGNNCGLCDLEKFYITSKPELASLNQRNELATSCRHRKNTYFATNKLILTQFTITHYHLWWVIPLLMITFDEQRSKAINTFNVNTDSLDRPGLYKAGKRMSTNAMSRWLERSLYETVCR